MSLLPSQAATSYEIAVLSPAVQLLPQRAGFASISLRADCKLHSTTAWCHMASGSASLIKIVVADDSAVIRHLIRKVLHRPQQWELVREADDWWEKQTMG